MVNQKGEFPKSEIINMRVHPRIKRKAKELPFTYGEIFEVGIENLSKEIDRLVYKKGELELDIAELKKEVHAKEANLTAINNRIRIINPTKLDQAKHTILSTAREWGYDGTKFLELVCGYLEEMCNTRV